MALQNKQYQFFMKRHLPHTFLNLKISSMVYGKSMLYKCCINYLLNVPISSLLGLKPSISHPNNHWMLSMKFATNLLGYFLVI